MEFNTVKIDKYEINPWSWGKVKKLYPHFKVIYIKCKDNNISLSDLKENLVNLSDFIFSISDVFTDIISITLDTDKNEIDNLSFETIIQMFLVIINQNLDYLSNLLSPIQEIVKKIMKNVP